MRIIKCAQNDNENYSNTVEVTIYGLEAAKPGMIADEISWKVNVPFRIVIDRSDWGFRSIEVKPSGMVAVPVGIAPETGGRSEDIEIAFDAGMLKQDQMPADHVTVGEIDLWVKPDLSPDYERSSITVYGPFTRWR